MQELMNLLQEQSTQQAALQQARLAQSDASATAAQKQYSDYIASMQSDAAKRDAAAAAAQEEQKRYIHQLSQGRMASLQELLGSQRLSEEQDLKNALAQRGLLDSGSLGAGLGNIYNNINTLLSQGSMAASQDEAGQLANLMGIASQRDYETRQALRQGIGSGLQNQMGYGLEQSRMGMQGQQGNTGNLLDLLRIGQQGSQFGQELGQRQSQFGTNTLMGLSGQQQQRDQFYANMGLQRDQLSESSKQFYDDLAYRRWAQQGAWDTARDTQPSGWDALLGGLGQGVGTAGGALLAGLL